MGEALAGAGPWPEPMTPFRAVPAYRGRPWFLPLAGAVLLGEGSAVRSDRAEPLRLQRNDKGSADQLRLSNAEVLQHTARYLDLIAGRDMSDEEKQALIAETVDSYERYYNRGFISYRKAVTQAGQFAALEWTGQGALLHDLLGREYIDCLGGYGIFSAGVNHPEDREGRHRPARPDGAQQPGAARAVARRAGPGAGRGDAGRSAELVLHQQRHRRHRRAPSSSPGSTPGVHTFISTLGGFHGKSMGSLSLMGKASFREPFQSGLQDVRFVPYGDADALEDELRRCDAVGTHIAGVVLEPVQGEAGGVVPPDDYFPRARALCTQFGALLIADEIQTGMGRTGKLWGVDHWNVVPDIMCLGKSHRRRGHAPLGLHRLGQGVGSDDPQPDHPLHDLRGESRWPARPAWPRSR